MVRRTDTHQAAIDKVTAAELRLREMRRGARARAEEIVQKELAPYQYAVDMAVYEAMEQGARQAWLAVRDEGLLVTDPQKVKAAYERGRALSGALSPDEDGPIDGTPQFQYDAKTGTLTIAATEGQRTEFEMAHAKGAFGWTWAEIVGDPELRFATFSTDPLLPLTDDWMPHRFDRHPVVAMYGAGSELERAAMKFVEAARNRARAEEEKAA